jgi:Protein of unknown function (DUF4232)
MHLPINSPKRLIGAAALAFAAALIPAAALAAPSSPAAPAASTPACSTAGVVVWMNTNGDGFAGGVGYTLNFTNLSGHACTLHGTPSVSAVTLSGHQLGRPASGNYSGNTPTVRLASGATATALLTIHDATIPRPSACHPVTVAGLRVYPPNQFASKVIPYPFLTCSSTKLHLMEVGAVTKG